MNCVRAPKMDLDKLKVVDLRKELQQRGLDTKGVKAALVKRLKDALDAESQGMINKICLVFFSTIGNKT